MDDGATKRYLPWLVATVLFMDRLDATIVNTCIPAMAAGLGTTPLALKSVVSSYLLSMAVGIPASGWLAERHGSRRVFLGAVALFTASSLLCGLAASPAMLVAARIPQGVAAAMMIPVGRMAIVSTFPKDELLRAMNFVVVPALIGPLLGPTLGGLIVQVHSWRDVFFINLPVGLAAFGFGWRHMPDYRGDTPRPFDLRGFVLFGAGVALLSWVLEIFGEHAFDTGRLVALLALSVALLAGYGWHARRVRFPLLRLALFRRRTFRVAVLGGFATRLGVGGMPFLLPLLYQVGMGLPAWQSGLLMMPTAAGAIGMKAISRRTLRRFGFRGVLVVNTVLIAAVIAAWSRVGPGTPLALIVAFSLLLGLFNSLQFSSMNSMAYADIDRPDAAAASTLASTMQQMSMSFGLACGSLLTGFYLSGLAHRDPLAVTGALHHAFLTLAALTLVSSLSFWSLRPQDGDSVSRGSLRTAP